MKQFSLLMMFMLNFIVSFSQKFEWLYSNTTNQTLGYGNPKIKTDPWGNTFIMGRYNGWMANGTDSMISFGGGAVTFFLTKLDPAGNWMWSKTFAPQNSSVYDMCIDANGYVYATIYCNGFINYDDGDTSFNFPNILTLNKIVSFDNNGKVRWGIEHPEGGNKAPLASSSTMHGFFTAGGNELCRIDTSGNVVWSRTVSGNFQFIGLEYNNNSTLAASGYGSAGSKTFGGVSFSFKTSTSDVAVFRMDTSGGVQWVRVLPALVDESTYSIQNEMLVSNSSEVYVLYRKPNGVLNYTFSSDTIFNPYCPTCISGAVLKLSSDGVPLWARGVYGDNHVRLMDFLLNDNEEIILLGEAASITYFGNNVFDNNFGLGYYGTFFAAKLLANGNYSWFKSDRRIIGQLVYDTPYGICRGLNNTYTVLGSRILGLASAFQLGCLSDSNRNEGFFAVNISEDIEPLPSAEFQFTMTGSMLMAHRPDEPNVSYSWNYGDGSPASDRLKTLHQYAQPGVYNLCLNATNHCGTNTKCAELNYSGVRAIISNKGGQGGVIDVNVLGGGFNATATFRLKKSGSPDIIPVRDSVIGSGQIWGRLDLRNASLGVYDVEVSGPIGGPFILPNAFTVEPLRPATVTVTASANRASRINSWHKSTITISNQGNENALMVPLFVEFPIDLDFFYYGAPIDRHSISGIEQGNDSIDLAGWFHLDQIAATDSQFFIKRISQIIPFILPGQSLSFVFYMKSNVGAEIRRMVQVRQPLFASAALVDNALEPQDPSALAFMFNTAQNWYGLPVDTPSYMNYLKYVLRSYVNTFAKYTPGNGGVASNGGPIGGLNTVGGGGYSGYASGRQPSGAPIHPPIVLPVLVEGCSSCCTGPNCSALPPPAANLPPPIPCSTNGCCSGCNNPPAGFSGKPRSPYNPPPGGGCFPCPAGDLDDIIFWANSFDPNAKYGPQLFGDIYLNDIENKSYTITFENLSTATAPAQTVVVIDTLDPSRFDLRSFRFGSITIGDSLFVNLEERNFSQLHVARLNPLMNLWVAIEADFDTTSGIARWQFTSIDPATKTTPIDPLVGFLPPNINQSEGTGSVSFIINYKPSLLHGSDIRNDAMIYFDNNDPIQTNDYLNILDFNPPESRIDPISPSTSKDTILLTISGSDDLSGVAFHEVYVSENDKPYILLDVTRNGQAQFVGSIGNKYEFYSIAHDKAGNVEAPPLNADENPDVVTTIISTTSQLSNLLPDLTIYPNPTSSMTYIGCSVPIHRVVLMDVSGMEVDVLMINGKDVFQMDMDKFAPGLYFVACETVAGDRLVRRLVKN